MFLKLESPRNITGSLKTQNCQVQGNTQSQPGPVSRVKDFGSKVGGKEGREYLRSIWRRRVAQMFGLKELKRAFLQYNSPSKVPSEPLQLNMA